MKQLELNKNDPRVAHLVRSYRGRRTIKVTEGISVHISNYWDGGSKETTHFVELSTGRVLDFSQVGYVQQKQGNPYSQQIGEAELQPGVAAVTSVVFMGKDLGYRLKLHPSDFNKL